MKVARKKCFEMTPAQRDAWLAGPDGPVNEADERGFTPLHVAAVAGNDRAIEILITRGALIEAVTRPQGWRALHLASRSGDARSVQALLDAGAFVDPRTAGLEQTPLHLCTDGDAARALLESGADPAAADLQGRTALHFAAEAGRVDVGDAVVAFGGVKMLEVADGDHWLPEATAEYYGRKDFVRFCQLLEAEASRVAASRETPESLRKRIIEELPQRTWAGPAWDAGLLQYRKREVLENSTGGARNLAVDERLALRRQVTAARMRDHKEATQKVWAAAEKERDKLLLQDASLFQTKQRTAPTSGTEGTMPLTGVAPVVDEYISNLRDDSSDPVACRRLSVYSQHFDPLKDYLDGSLSLLPDDRTVRPPLSLRRTPRECHTILFGGERE